MRYFVVFTGTPRDEIAAVLALTGERRVVDYLTALREARSNDLPDDVLAVSVAHKWLNVALTPEQRDALRRGGLTVEAQGDLSGTPLLAYGSQNIADYAGRMYANPYAYTYWPGNGSAGTIGQRIDYYKGGGNITWDKLNLRGVIRGSKLIDGTIPYLGIQSLHDRGYRGQGMKVGVIDTGATVGNPHPDVPVASAFDPFDGNETVDDDHTWGRISQLGANTNMLGYCPEAEIHHANTSNVLASALHLIDVVGVDVISISYTGSANPAMDALIKDFKRKGGHLCVSAGNNPPTSDPVMINSLAATTGAIPVGAVPGGTAYQFGAESYYTSILPNRGKGIRFFAPLAAVTAATGGTEEEPWYNPYSAGTSSSAPVIAGMHTLLKQMYPDLLSETRENLLFNSGDRIGGASLPHAQRIL